MKVTCDVIADLMPLYAENMLSEDSRKLVEEHMASCSGCRGRLKEMKVSANPASDMEKMPLRKLKKTVFRKKAQAVAAAVLATLLIGVVAAANLTAPEYYPFSPELVSIREAADGTVYAILNDEVSGYGVSTYRSDDGTGYAYHLVAWDSFWDRKLFRQDTADIVLNANGEKVSAVYYYETDGTGEKLLYGEQQSPCGVLIRQPKLELFLTGAAAAALLCGALLLLNRKNRKAAPALLSALLLPVSYLLSHLLVMGFSIDTHSASLRFWNILLCTVPVYGVLWSLARYTVMRGCRKP